MSHPQALFVQCAHGNGDAQTAGEARRHLDCIHRIGVGAGTPVLSAAERVAGFRGLRRVCRGGAYEVFSGQGTPSSIVRRDTGESYEEFLRGLAKASGITTPTREELARLDRKRQKRMSNQEWKSPADEDARIAKMKAGRTHLALA